MEFKNRQNLSVQLKARMHGCSWRQEKGASGVLLLYYDVTVFTLLKIVTLLRFVHF